MPKLGTICITNQSPSKVVIDIEGIIGVPEWWQFDDPADRISTFDKFKKKCQEIKDLKASEIIVNIRSMGGSVEHAFLIHDSLCTLESEITTVCYGYTASAATLIAQAGQVRQISNNALYLIHQCSGVVRGNIADMESGIDLLRKTNERIVALYVNRSGKTEEYIREILDRKNGNGEWLSPDEAVNLGLADEVIVVSGTVNMDSELFAELGYPQIPENLFPEETVDNSQKNNFIMKITNSLKAIWSFFKFPEDKGEEEISFEQLQKINDELENRQHLIDSLTTERDRLKNDVSERDTKIAELEKKVGDLQGKPGASTKESTTPTDSPVKEDDMTGHISSAKTLYDSIKDF